MMGSRKKKICILSLLSFLLVSCTKEYIVTIKSDPDNVRVYDVRLGELGYTNLDVQAEGRGSEYPMLNLTFSKEGYVEKKLDILKIKNDQTVMVTLHSAPTYLYVESIPSSAKIKMFNKEGTQLTFIDTSKITRKDYFANSRYQVAHDLDKVMLQLMHQGYKTLTKEITIEAHKENRFSFQLEKVKPVLKVNSIPNGAEVYERTLGFLGRTPLALNINWNQLIRLSQKYDVMNTVDVNLQLHVKKQGYKEKELVQGFQLYNHNPAVWVTLEKETDKPGANK